MTLAEAYRRTIFRAGPVLARPGMRSVSADEWLAGLAARQAAFITAWNPMSRRHPPGWNLRRQAALRGALRRKPALEGMSGTRFWQEHNLLVAADARLLLRVARQFRQAAILCLRRGQPARLLFNPRFAAAVPRHPPPGCSPAR
ncbi:DUF3293 domain-containing protein [Sediminicoccus sp. KRV36]|uniref:DUF3293 domain-containing protein n=1 Tax=Sediminicoccus sp. KRV36 TaxID=3133721 RepID=UPI00200C0131|nr:DUF3293 domain-containing protein [Sediminicoccus rosea]UPY39187.1 DUF3293 domain-containing protein [Sediminicoccus rosea]